MLIRSNPQQQCHQHGTDLTELYVEMKNTTFSSSSRIRLFCWESKALLSLVFTSFFPPFFPFFLFFLTSLRFSQTPFVNTTTTKVREREITRRGRMKMKNDTWNLIFFFILSHFMKSLLLCVIFNKIFFSSIWKMLLDKVFKI